MDADQDERAAFVGVGSAWRRRSDTMACPTSLLPHTCVDTPITRTWSGTSSSTSAAARETPRPHRPSGQPFRPATHPWERVKQSDAEIISEVADKDYGNREFSIADPEGNLWSFGPYRGEQMTS